MKHAYLFLAVFSLTLPAIASAQSLQALLTNIPKFISTVLIPFLFGIAFLMFTINVIRYFVIGSTNEKDRENAKYLAVYSVAAFVFLIIFWGIINLLTTSTGLQKKDQPCPDLIKQYDPSKCP